MKRATVSIQLTATGEWYEVSGYACEIDGLELVVHHLCEGPDPILGAPAFDASKWTVTEPRTGRSIYQGAPTRSAAIKRAQAEIQARGGAQVVRTQVAALADPEAALLTTLGEPKRPREELVAAYAAAIRVGGGKVNWSKVNAAIVERLSKTALREIKRRAWEIVEDPTSSRAA